MHIRSLQLAFAVALAITVAGTGGPAFASSAAETHGLPARLSSLTDLTPILERTDIGKADKTQVLLDWLAEERKVPTPTFQGLGGGDVDSGYIQAQLIRAMVEVGDLVVLLKTASDPEVDANLRDAVRLVLGLKGDRRQVSELVRILDTHSEPYFRALAAKALGSLGATEAIPSLERAMEDQFTQRAGNSLRGTYTAYPVREAAQVALRVLRNPAGMDFSRQRREGFKRQLDDAQRILGAAGTAESATLPAVTHAEPCGQVEVVVARSVSEPPYPELREAVVDTASGYLRAWVARDFSAMYDMLDDESKAATDLRTFRTDIEKEEKVLGMPVRLVEVGKLYALVLYHMAVELPGEAKEAGRSVSQAGLPGRGYDGGFVSLLREADGWRVWKDFPMIRDAATKYPVSTARVWDGQGFDKTIAASLAAHVPLVPENDEATAGSAWAVARQYLKAWVEGDYHAMYALRAKTPNRPESYAAFETEMGQRRKALQPLFVADTLRPRFMLSVGLERKGGTYPVQRLGLDAGASYEGRKSVFMVKQGSCWRVETLRVWSNHRDNLSRYVNQKQADSGACAASTAGGAPGQAHGGACCSGSSDTKAKGESQGQTGSAVCGCGCWSGK